MWLPAGVVVTATCAYAVWVGGDFMPMGRFLVPMLPFVALLLARALAGPRLSSGGVALTAGCVLLSVLAAFDAGPVPAAIRARFNYRRRPPDLGERGAVLARHEATRRGLGGRGARAGALHGADESMILGAMGARAYFGDFTVYDTYGLVTPEVHRLGRLRRPSSPGHDLRVEEGVLLHHEPTYLGSFLTPADEPPLARIPDYWRPQVEVVRHPLPPEDGFPAGTELRLVRLK